MNISFSFPIDSTAKAKCIGGAIVSGLTLWALFLFGKFAYFQNLNFLNMLPKLDAYHIQVQVNHLSKLAWMLLNLIIAAWGLLLLSFDKAYDAYQEIKQKEMSVQFEK